MSQRAAKFVPGITLSGLFYRRAVRPILKRHWPGLKHSAALIGYGSDVLGFDDAMSRDHEWGPRVRLFLGEGDYKELAGAIHRVMADELPRQFMGYSTHFHLPAGGDCQVLGPCCDGPLNHRVEAFTVRKYFARHGIAPDAPMTAAGWLTASEQSLLELTRGEVFHDGLGQLRKIRARLQYYPRDVWLYLLACQWTRIGQEESMVGRAGLVGDDVGSRVIAARLVRDVMRLCFMMERQYAPYSKWFGTAFSRLRCARKLAPALEAALSARNWRQRGQRLADVYELAARMHNALKITPPLEATRRNFHGRPFVVISGDRFSNAIVKKIRSREVKTIKVLIGGVDQFSDSCDLLDNPKLCAKLRPLFGEVTPISSLTTV